MSSRKESKQQRRSAIMEKRRRMDQVASQIIQERVEYRLAMIEEQESTPEVDATAVEVV
jgi:hypothetical protein